MVERCLRLKETLFIKKKKRKKDLKMEQWQIVQIKLIPLYAFLVVVIIGPLLDYFYRIQLTKKCKMTEDFVGSNQFGLVCYICGNIGAGKTTLGSALTNYLTKIKINQAKAKLEEIQRKLSFIDFNEINETIEAAFMVGRLTNVDAIFSYLFDFNKDLEKKLEGFYNNYLWPNSYISLLRDYIDAYLALLRNNYVYFLRRKYYNFVTNNFAMDYTPAMIDIKDRHINKDYSIQRYTTIFEDEKVLSGKVSTDFQSIAEEDGGGDEFLRLIRHFGKGSINYISTAQDFERIVKQERELATSIIYINKRDEIESFNLKTIGINMLLDVLSRWKNCIDAYIDDIRLYKLKKFEAQIKIKSKYEETSTKEKKQLEELSKNNSLRISKLRIFINKLTGIQERNFADEFIRYKADHYFSSKDVGIDTKGAKIDLCSPLSWAYGSTDTYSFSILADFLSLESIDKSEFYDPKDNYIPQESDLKFENYIESLLRKRLKKKKQKNEDPTNLDPF